MRGGIGGRLRSRRGAYIWLREHAARRATFGAACIILAACYGASAARAGESGPTRRPSSQSTGSRAAREDAIRSIPFHKLDPATKATISQVVSHASIYRRLPSQVIDCDPALYLFMVRNPHVIVSIWELMQVSNVALVRTGPDSYRASDGDGTLGLVKYCYSNHDTQLIYAEGSYEGPLFNRPVRAKCVLLLKSGYIEEANGRSYVTSRLDTFLAIDHAGVEFIAKTLQPLVVKSAEYNFSETAAFLGNVSRTAETNPRGMVRLAAKLPDIEPEVRQQFAELAVEVSQRAIMRQAASGDVAGPLVAIESPPRLVQPAAMHAHPQARASDKKASGVSSRRTSANRR